VTARSVDPSTTVWLYNMMHFECKWAVTRWQWLLYTYINMKERGQERIGWERIITFCVAKEKEKLFNAERLQIS